MRGFDGFGFFGFALEPNLSSVLGTLIRPAHLPIFAPINVPKFREHSPAVLTDAGIRTIHSLPRWCDYKTASAMLGHPFLVKPRRSSASKGIVTIRSQDDFDYWLMKLGDNFMAQEIVGDNEHEYTVGAFGLGDGSISQSIAMVRTLSREGSTARASVVDLPELDAEVQRLARLLKPLGPTNFQFRRHEGNYLLLEVNPRFSSSLSIRTAFGFNEPEMCIEYFLNGQVPARAEIKHGNAVRYIEDVITLEAG